MKKNNNSYISNATMTVINESAQYIAQKFNGEVKRNDTLNKEKKIFSDEELTKYHNDIYIARVEFSNERHDAIEITTTSRLFYIAYGDTVSRDIIDALKFDTECIEAKRIEKWNMKNRRTFDIRKYAEIIESVCTEQTAKKQTTKQTAKKSTTKSAPKKQTAKKSA